MITWLDRLDGATIRTALSQWTGGHVLALVADSDRDGVPELQSACRDLGIGVCGALFPDLLVNERLGNGGAILLPVAGPPPLLIGDLSTADGIARTATALTGYVESHRAPDDFDAALLCIFDALVPNIASHLDAWHLKLADRVRYFGANAGNEAFAPRPCLFNADRFIGEGLLAQLLPGHPGGCVSHGYDVPDALIAATSSDGNRIIQIDWRPALEVYGELMHQRYGIQIDRESFYRYAVHFPFGIVRADGELLVRIPVALGPDDSIACVGEVPANAILTLLDARACTDRVPSDIAACLAEISPVTGRDLLVFYCAGRRMHKGAEVPAELDAIRTATGAAHLYGALSLGEIGASAEGGYPLFHNATVVGVPWNNA